MDDKEVKIGNPLREVGAQFEWDFLNPNIRSRSLKPKGLEDEDDYKYYLTVEISKEFHELLVDAKRTGMHVANRGQVISLNDDYSEALKKGTKQEPKQERCQQAIDYHEEHKKWPSNTAEAMCKENNLYWYLRSLGIITPNADDSYEARDNGLKEWLQIDSKTKLDTNHEALTMFMGMLADYRKFVQDKQ